MKFRHRFVEFIPEELEDGVLYISLVYGSVVHKCACGCGNEVNTPLSPIDWKITFNGETVTLKPSIGNWSFDCKSHYWIVNNVVKWSTTWDDEKIQSVREFDAYEREDFYHAKDTTVIEKKTKSNKLSEKWYDILFFWK